MKEKYCPRKHYTCHCPIILPTESHFPSASDSSFQSVKINNSLQFTFNLEGGES